MSSTPDVRSQLRSLSIPAEHRPEARAARSRGRWLRRVVVMALLIAGGYAAWRHMGGAPVNWNLAAAIGSTGPAPASVALLTVSARPTSEPPPTLTATGRIVSDHKVAVSTKVSGQIVSLHFEQGDRVDRGQMLARIEDVNYRALRDEAQAQLQQAQANLAYQQVNFARVEDLRAAASAKDIELADARRWLEDARALLAREEARLAFAQKALDDCEVIGPIAGVILERNVEVGDFVAAEGGRGANANAQFALIADMTKLRVEVDVSELDIARIRENMPCRITPDAYKDRRFRGHVMWIDPAANYSKATVQVKVRIENPDAFLRVEGSAQVMFFGELDPSGRDAGRTLWIPATACVVNDSGDAGTVFRAVDGRLAKTVIAIGRRAGGQIEVTSGLSEGQQIVSTGLDGLADGQRIAP